MIHSAVRVGFFPPCIARHFVTASGSLGYIGDNPAGSPPTSHPSPSPITATSAHATGSNSGSITAPPAPTHASRIPTGKNRSAISTFPAPANPINPSTPISRPASNPPPTAVTQASRPLLASATTASPVTNPHRSQDRHTTCAVGTPTSRAPVTSATNFALVTAIRTAVNPPGPTLTAISVNARGFTPANPHARSTATINPSSCTLVGSTSARPRSTTPSAPTTHTTTPGAHFDRSVHADGLLVSIANIQRSPAITQAYGERYTATSGERTMTKTHPSKNTRPLAVAISAAISLASAHATALADDPTPTPTPTATDLNIRPAQLSLLNDSSSLHVRFEPGAWYAGLSGEVSLPRNSAALNAPNPSTDLNDLNTDQSRLTPFGELHIWKGKWRGTLRGYLFNTEKTTTGLTGQIGDVTFNPSDTVSTSLDLNSFDVEAAYRFYEYTHKTDPTRLQSSLDVILGARAFDAELSIDSTTGGSQQADELWVHPIVGAKWTLKLAEQFTVDLQLDGGTLPLGDNSSTSFGILVGGTWQPKAIPNLGLQIGYRAQFFDLSKDEQAREFSLSDGSLQGLYFGAVLEF